MRYMPNLTTLTRVRRHRGMADAATGDDTLLLDLIADASGQVTRGLNRIPHPYVATRTVDYGGAEMVTTRKLLVGEDLLAITTLTNGDSTTVSSGNYVLRPNNLYPKYAVQLTQGSGLSWTYSTTPEQALSIAGIWGYAPHYASGAWKSLTTTTEALDSSETGVDVTATTGIEVGGYIRIGTEQMLVSSISGLTLTVERGVNGTTAATADSGASVAFYQQLADIRAATTEIVVYLYKTKDQVGGSVEVMQNGTVIVEGMPKGVQETVDNHRRISAVAVGG